MKVSRCQTSQALSLTYKALGWVEYCNSDRNSYYANLRRQNGREKPYNVHHPNISL